MNPFNTKKNINLKTNKEPESKIENIPSKINLNSSETNKDLKPTKFLTIKIVPFRINNNKNKNKNDDSKKNKDSKNGRWTLKEHIEFLNGIAKYGNDLSKIKINTRNSNQIRSHAQKFFKKLKKVNDEQLGINFTPNYIKTFKDMVNHIEFVNHNYDIANVFLYLSEKYEKKKVKLNYKKIYINHNQENNGLLLNEEKNDNVEISINNIGHYVCNDIKLDNINMNLINNFVAYSFINIVLINNINEQLKNVLFLLNYIKNYYIERKLINNKDININNYK